MAGEDEGRSRYSRFVSERQEYQDRRVGLPRRRSERVGVSQQTEGQIGAGARSHKYLCGEVESVVGGIVGGIAGETTRCPRGESGVRAFEERDLGGMTGGVAMSGEIVRPGGTSGTLNQGEAVDGDLTYRVLQ